MASKANSSSTSSSALVIAALGVVFGDIGTSPLYALRESFHSAHGLALNSENIFGVLSLVLWSLISIVSVKYLFFVMNADNRGEGGALALTALVSRKRRSLTAPKSYLLYVGLFGAALLFGDGVLTPAISILSAVEGLKLATPLFEPYVVPITIFVLIVLFMSQRFGSSKIGSIFGPVILVWFITLGALGVHGILMNPSVIEAISPHHAVVFLLTHGHDSILVLGAVFLAVTGAEALYADMGHFGKSPIRKAWFFVAFPGLVLNYFGQGALLLTDATTSDNPFYKLVPSWGLYPMIILSTAATVIASQALITGVFSLTRQAIQLGYAPRIPIVHTSDETIGQIYIPKINMALLILTIWLVVEFKSSSALAGAYGIAVALTMAITTWMSCVVAKRRWKWSSPTVGVVLVVFMTIDMVYLGANSFKIIEGGWVPLLMGVIVFVLMTTWKTGRLILAERMRRQSIPLNDFVHQIRSSKPARVEGTAFFLTGDPEGTPPALLHNVKHNKVLHNRVLLLTILSIDEPIVSRSKRVEYCPLTEGLYRVKAYYGFMERPDIRDIILILQQQGFECELENITFFLGRETLIPSNQPGMAIWREKLFAFMSKNAERANLFFNIPSNQVVEVGLQVEI